MAGPLLLFAGIVWNAKRRAVKQAQTSADADEDMPALAGNLDSPQTRVDADE